MPEDLRAKCARRSAEAIAMARGGCPKRLQKSPPERHSIALRKKLTRTVHNPLGEIEEDCRDCPKYPCGMKLASCDQPSMIRKCNRCGERVRFRIIETADWKLCPICEAKS